jgi:uncharacterized sulfatase
VLRSILATLVIAAALPAAAAERPIAPNWPNILWITSEDNGPHLGCYGDEYADTPHIDRLASRGVIYLNAWSNAPVCAPARTTIISGLYPTSLGAQHMRSLVAMPPGFQMFPQYLRKAGYYCTNNSKEDYNLKKPGQVWDESSGQAHWRNRKDGQPFFAVFNFTTTHESQVRKRPHQPVHDPAKVRVPAYHPDTPEVRRDWAQYYDKLTEMDRQVGRVLEQLEEDGLTEDTIVFYFGDHGPGLPRGKRSARNSGLRVPLVVAIPEKWRHLAATDYRPGGKSDRLVGFIDLAPTVLSLAGIEKPQPMQGTAFLGEHAGEPNELLHGFRGRMDERTDMVRSTRDKRYVYVRHFMPHRRYGEHVEYMFQTPTTQVWHRLFEEGKLTPEQAQFWQTKPTEELFDLQTDPDEVHNLADSPQHQEILKRLRGATHDFLLRTRDTGFLPEPMMHARAERADKTIYEMAQDPAWYPLDKILPIAELATQRAGETDALIDFLDAADPAIRYWSALGLIVRGDAAVGSGEEALRSKLKDDSPSVRIVAAEALARYGSPKDREAALQTLIDLANIEAHGPFTSTMALNALDACGPLEARYVKQVRELPTRHPSLNQRLRMPAVPRSLIGHIVEQSRRDENN